ncbi:MAG: hypothetical protein KDA61_02135 [Planctomycetales bacterium]|nr:hypothetical protein [Planctomycetales bacterium]
MVVNPTRFIAFVSRLRGGAGRRALALAVVAIGAAFAGAYGDAMAEPANPSQMGEATANGRRQISLADQLKLGLRAYTPADRQYLDHVVHLVQTGVLPRSLVDSTFLWARSRAVARKGRNPLRPIVYFQPALTLRARRLGISI